jgi:hypothetical protein
MIIPSGMSPIEHTAEVKVKGTKISFGVGVGVRIDLSRKNTTVAA